MVAQFCMWYSQGSVLNTISFVFLFLIFFLTCFSTSTHLCSSFLNKMLNRERNIISFYYRGFLQYSSFIGPSQLVSLLCILHV